jgi:hypothetical protein
MAQQEVRGHDQAGEQRQHRRVRNSFRQDETVVVDGVP